MFPLIPTEVTSLCQHLFPLVRDSYTPEKSALWFSKTEYIYEMDCISQGKYIIIMLLVFQYNHQTSGFSVAN